MNILGKSEKMLMQANDANICVQIVLNALQAGTDSHSSTSFLQPTHKLSVHYVWQDTEGYEGLMGSHTNTVPSLLLPIPVAL